VGHGRVGLALPQRPRCGGLVALVTGERTVSSRLLEVRRFPEGAAVLGNGWFLRIGKLRLMWAPSPDPTITRVVADEDLISKGEPQTYTIRHVPPERAA